MEGSAWDLAPMHTHPNFAPSRESLLRLHVFLAPNPLQTITLFILRSTSDWFCNILLGENHFPSLFFCFPFTCSVLGGVRETEPARCLLFAKL